MSSSSSHPLSPLQGASTIVGTGLTLRSPITLTTLVSSNSNSLNGVNAVSIHIQSNRTAGGNRHDGSNGSCSVCSNNNNNNNISSNSNNNNNNNNIGNSMIDDDDLDYHRHREITQDDINNSNRWGQAKMFYTDHCIYLPAMLGWFAFSAGLSFYNKTVFGENHRGFKCPLLLTSVHFLAQWIFGYVVTTIFPVLCGTDRIRSMTWKEWWAVSFPCGLVTSGDVGLSNLSLVTISMTFYTMVKSSTPIFVLLWAYIFGIEKVTWNLMFVVFIIACGELLTVAGEVDFHPVGFLLCLGASVLSGARWTLVQLKLRTMDPPLKTVVTTMRLLAPCMFWSMFVVSIIVERPWIRLADSTWKDLAFDLFVLGMIGAVIAISMILCEFWLIMKSNAIVLMLGGVIKEMITIIVGVACFGDELNRINVSGCFVVFVGVFYYKFTHYVDSRRPQGGVQAIPTIEPSNSITGRGSPTHGSPAHGSPKRGSSPLACNGVGISNSVIACNGLTVNATYKNNRGYSRLKGDESSDRISVDGSTSSTSSSSSTNIVTKRLSRYLSETGESTSELTNTLRRPAVSNAEIC